MMDAYSAYFAAAKSGEYPKLENSHHMKKDEYDKFLELIEKRR
jgi:hypothetical protein